MFAVLAVAPHTLKSSALQLRSFAKPFALLPVGRKLQENNSRAKTQLVDWEFLLVVLQDSHETVKGQTLETLHPKLAKNLAH